MPGAATLRRRQPDPLGRLVQTRQRQATISEKPTFSCQAGASVVSCWQLPGRSMVASGEFGSIGRKWLEFGDNLLKSLDSRKELNFEFVPENLDFVPSGLDFVPLCLGFVRGGLETLPCGLEGRPRPALRMRKVQLLASNALKSPARFTKLRGVAAPEDRAKGADFWILGNLDKRNCIYGR